MNGDLPATGAGRGSSGADETERLATAALAFIAADPERLGDFLALTGTSPASLRAAAAGPGFLRGILAYVLGDEAVLVAFAASESREPGRVARAMEAALGPSGGDD